MTTFPQRPSSDSSPAIAAFLRGVERRASAFAQWQCGDVDAGDTAVAIAMAGFVLQAPRTPFAEWPRRFWAQLLAVPAIRTPVTQPQSMDGLPALAGLAAGPRVTVLLRLVAGLPEQEAAAVLGVSRATYRLGLRRALPHRDDGSPDAEAWRKIADDVQAAVRSMPAERIARLVALREAAIQGRTPSVRRFPLQRPARPAARESVPGQRAPWMWPALIAVLLATVAALAATWWDGASDDADAAARIRTEPLPESGPPAATYDADIALLTEPDLELLLDADADADADTGAWRADPAFHAWLSARDPKAMDETANAHLQSLDEDPDDTLETADDDL